MSGFFLFQKKNPNQRTTGSGYLKNIQNQKHPWFRVFQNAIKEMTCKEAVIFLAII
jgi:hypothetical protein